MWAWLFVCFIGGIVIYGIVPTIIIRKKRVRLFREGTASDCLALTFDDGPDPYYTPKLLDLLKKYGVKATFFVVGRKVERYPDIVRRMAEEGHEIGIHNYRHISNWLLPPLWLDWGVRRAAKAIERATGKQPMYYRPPWGILTLGHQSCKSGIQRCYGRIFLAIGTKKLVQWNCSAACVRPYAAGR
ncbi:Peptidoglycan-N-acetylmuramic acid deacetylase PdaC [Geobacillus sp. BCO2]|nr:Peptidoglycan-N-acetylmuramic acid deacetylase PdaC [Geobacillus sp. BCO2]